MPDDLIHLEAPETLDDALAGAAVPCTSMASSTNPTCACRLCGQPSAGDAAKYVLCDFHYVELLNDSTWPTLEGLILRRRIKTGQTERTVQAAVQHEWETLKGQLKADQERAAVDATLQRLTEKEWAHVADALDTIQGIPEIVSGKPSEKRHRHELVTPLVSLMVESVMESAERAAVTTRLKTMFPEVTATVIQKKVDEAYKEQAKAAAEAEVSGRQVAPWPDPVDGAALLDQIKTAVLQRHIIMSDEAATAVALWILFSHAHEAFTISPYLTITSPTKRCGKTTLVGTVMGVVPRVLLSSNITPQALFRTIEDFKPTLLIDEADTFLGLSDEMRGLLNASHTKHTATVIRLVGDDFKPKKFSTWCPKLLSLIGALPDTLMDRSILIPMRRKRKEERVVRFRADKTPLAFEPLFRQAMRWAADHLEELREADPTLPEELDDRAQDNWRGLTAVADLAGGDWPMKARNAALALSGEEVRAEGTVAVKLLSDIKAYFELDRNQGKDGLSSYDIV